MSSEVDLKVCTSSSGLAPDFRDTHRHRLLTNFERRTLPLHVVGMMGVLGLGVLRRLAVGGDAEDVGDHVSCLGRLSFGLHPHGDLDVR